MVGNESSLKRKKDLRGSEWMYGWIQQNLGRFLERGQRTCTQQRKKLPRIRGNPTRTTDVLELKMFGLKNNIRARILQCWLRWLFWAWLRTRRNSSFGEKPDDSWNIVEMKLLEKFIYDVSKRKAVELEDAVPPRVNWLWDWQISSPVGSLSTKNIKDEYKRSKNEEHPFSRRMGGDYMNLLFAAPHITSCPSSEILRSQVEFTLEKFQDLSLFQKR